MIAFPAKQSRPSRLADAVVLGRERSSAATAAGPNLAIATSPLRSSGAPSSWRSLARQGVASVPRAWHHESARHLGGARSTNRIVRVGKRPRVNAATRLTEVALLDDATSGYGRSVALFGWERSNVVSIGGVAGLLGGAAERGVRGCAPRSSSAASQLQVARERQTLWQSEKRNFHSVRAVALVTADRLASLQHIPGTRPGPRSAAAGFAAQKRPGRTYRMACTSGRITAFRMRKRRVLARP